MTLRAVTRQLRPDVDLNDIARGDGYLFVRDGVGIAARGVTARVPVDEVEATLSAIEGDDEIGTPGTGPVALGCLPFLPEAPAMLVVPWATVGTASPGAIAGQLLGSFACRQIFSANVRQLRGFS